MNILKLFTVFTLTYSLAIGSPYNEKTQDGLKIIRQLSQQESLILEKYIKAKAQKKKKVNSAQLISMKVKLSDILKSGTFKGTIALGTELINVENESIVYTTREIITNAYRLKDFEGYIFLINQDGSVSYKVHFKNISRIDDILNLDKSPLFYKALDKKPNTVFNDQDYIFETNLNLELGFNSSAFKSDLINQDNLIEQTIRYELETYIKWDFPINFGLLTGFEKNSTSLKRNSSIESMAIYLGPSIKTVGPFKYEYALDFKTSLYSNIQERSPIQTNDFNLSKSTLGLGFISKKPNSFGHFNWGINIQQSWIVANAQGTELALKDKVISEYSLTFFIGLGKDWRW